MGTGGDADPRDTSGKRFATDLDTLRHEVVIETYRSSGPGGQRKNKKETAVRLTHLLSGITVIASERRSQAMNREVAFERLQARLEQLNRPRKRRITTKPTASTLRKWEEEKKQHSGKKQLRSKQDAISELSTD